MTQKTGTQGALSGAVLAPPRNWKTLRWGRALNEYGMLAVLVILFLLATALSPTFLTTRNLLNVSRQVALNGILATGMTLAILTGGIDLSVGANLALASVLVAGLAAWGPAAILVALVAGAFFGLLNGLVVSFLKIHPFIVTLGAVSAVRGVALMYSRGHPIEGTPELVQTLARGSIGQVYIQAVILAIVLLLAFLLLRQTQLGTHIYAVGSNEEAARLSGVRVRVVKTIVYTLSGMLAALAGILVAGHLNVGDPQFGSGAELDAIAACVIGGIYLMGGRGGIAGTLLGLLIIGVIRNLLNLMNIPGDVQWIINGIIIVIAVAVQRFRE